MSRKLPPDRHFGVVFTTLFATLAGISYFRGGNAYTWLVAIAGLIGAITLARPSWLRPLNALWMRFAAVLHRIVSPVVLAAIFFVVVTPFGVVQRLAGRDSMRRKFDPEASSYWLNREPPGPPPGSLHNQF